LLPSALTLRIPLRNIFRAKRRSAYTIIGIAFAVLLTLGTSAFFDSVQYLLEHHFEAVEKWDVSAFFSGTLSDGQVRDVGRWDGVRRVQPALVVPAKLTANGVTHEGVVTALDPAADFHGFNISQGPAPPEALRSGGIVLAEVLAEKLGVDVGDVVRVKSPYREERVTIPVAAFSDELLGVPTYVNLTRGSELLGVSRPTYNALYLDADPRKATRLQERLYDMPGAQQVVVETSLRQGMRDMMAFMYFFLGVILAFGFAMAFVVIYNTFTANVIERTREIATMRTIGEDGAHLAGMVTLENLLLAVVGIPLGVWLGLRMADLVLFSMSSEQFNMRIVVMPGTYVWVILAAIVVLLLSEIPPIRRIFRLDLAEATKVME
jgi:putative ABC transport system permease protein